MYAGVAAGFLRLAASGDTGLGDPVIACLRRSAKGCPPRGLRRRPQRRFTLLFSNLRARIRPAGARPCSLLAWRERVGVKVQWKSETLFSRAF